MKNILLLSVIVMLGVGCSKPVATPSCLPSQQPNCAAGALSMYVAERMNQDIPTSAWNLTGDTVEVGAMLDSWNNHYDRPAGVDNPLEEKTAIQFNKPFIWVGKFQGGYHAALIYFSPTNVVIKNYVYDASTHTNYMETHDYSWAASNTVAFYGLKYD